MNQRISLLYRATQENIKRLSLFFMAAVIFFIAGALLVFFYLTLTKNFNEENEKIKANYINLQKDIIKTRVDQTYNFIQTVRKIEKNKSEEIVKQEILEALSKIRFNNNYIFVDTFNGYALLMNGDKLDKPNYIWDLADVKGKKILQEQLKAAKSSPEGGFVDYVWHEDALNKDMEQISFCRTIDDWKWKIGTGVYVGDINEEIVKRTIEFKKKLLADFLSVGGILMFITIISSVIAFFISKRTTSLFDDMNNKIDNYYCELEDVNQHLEQKVENEFRRRIDQEALLVQQSKMALMGQMLDSIAHQWKQPLNAISACVNDIYLATALGEAKKEDMDRFLAEVTEEIKFMSHTMDELRSFFAPTIEDEEFILSECIKASINLISAQLKNRSIDVSVQMPLNIKIKGRSNEIKNVILNIIVNAKDQIVHNSIKYGKITINVTVSDRTAILTVSDNGGGIIESLLPDKLFEHRISSKGNSGSGVGLWLVKLIIEKHHGTIKAYNSNEGAVFEIKLPTL